MILNILQRQNCTARLRRSYPVLSSPPPLDPLSTSDQSYPEHQLYVDRLDYPDAGCEKEVEDEECSNQQPLLCDEKPSEEVQYNMVVFVVHKQIFNHVLNV